MDNVGIVVDDLEDRGSLHRTWLEIDGRAQVEGAWVDSTVGLAGVRSDIV